MQFCRGAKDEFNLKYNSVCTASSVPRQNIVLLLYRIKVPSTGYKECWPCPLFNILLNQYYPAG
jgi:hypothetical protein